MKTSFKNLTSNLMNRKFGGATVGVAEPYISGYHFIWFDKLPSALTNYTSRGISGLDNIDDIKKILAASCLSVTPPGGTLAKVEFTGLGGIKWAVPGNIDYGNAVSVKFLEFSKTPILDIMHSWVKMIRDYRTGVTELEDTDEGIGYSNRTYAATMFYWTTAPDAMSIEYYAAYDGVFPTKDPQDLFSSDIETIGKLDIEIEFNCDYPWHEPWVKDKIENNYIPALIAARDNINAYSI